MATLFGNAAVSIKKRSLLPVLTVLFLFSYGLITLLIVEQGNTIQSQRALIEELFQDSVQLSGIKGKAVQEKNLADAQHRAQAPAANQGQSLPATPATPSTQAPSTQAPSSQAQKQSGQTPSSQAAPQRQAAQNHGKMRKPQMQMPSRPASDLADERRALITI